jgi:hypothetical protein
LKRALAMSSFQRQEGANRAPAQFAKIDPNSLKRRSNGWVPQICEPAACELPAA